MKNLAIAAVLFSLLAPSFQAATQTTAPPKAQSPAPAQALPVAPPASATPAPPSAAPAAAAVAQASEMKAKPTKRARGRVPSTADARVCLEFPTTMQIVKCSEKYRWAS